MNRQCPECLSSINKPFNCCGCGWKEITKAVKNDSRCHFIFENRRCPLTGTVVEGVKNNNMLCSAHWFARNDMELSRSLLDDMQAQPASWMKKVKDWRVEILEGYLNKLPKIYPSENITLEDRIRKIKEHLLVRK